MAQYLSPFAGRQFLDANGDPYVGALLFTYVAGSSTKVTTTKDSAGASNHTNPIVLNARGEPADGAGASQAIWQTGGAAVKFVLAPSTDSDPPLSAISTWDNISGINDASTTIDQWIAGPTPTYVGATQFTLAGDQTSAFHVGRRIKATITAGTVYGTITVSAYTALTTITVVLDSGNLDSGLSAVYYGILTATNSSIPGVETSGDDWTHQGNVTHEGTVTMTSKAILHAQVTLAAATTTDVLSAAGNTILMTGSAGAVTITSFGTSRQAGAKYHVTSTGTSAHVLTHNATSLICEGAANITVAQGDSWWIEDLGSNNCRLYGYTRADGSAFNVAAANITGTIATAQIAAGAVTQSRLSSTTGTVSVGFAAGPTDFTLPGGGYGFYPQVRGLAAGSSGYAHIMGETAPGSVPGTTFIANITLQETNGTGSDGIVAQQRYIQASPPYNLGDGDIPLFIFLTMSPLGEVLSSYVAPEAPWHHNGPTDIKADRYTMDGRSYKKVSRFCAEHGSLKSALAKGMGLAQVIDEMNRDVIEEVEMTQAIKNADMPLIPHPFLSLKPGNTVVLLDPVSKMIESLFMLHEAGESIAEIIHGRYLNLGAELPKMRCSPGVKPISFGWKLS